VTAEELSLQALRYSPESAFVQGTASQIEYIHDGDLATALAFASRSVEIDKADPMGWALLSNALAVNGRKIESYEAAKIAIDLSAATSSQFFFEHFACMAAASLANYDEALFHARTGLRLRPEFVSTRRYEVALAIELDDRVGAERAIAQMRLQEPGFAPEQMLDPHYPVNTMKRLPLIEALANLGNDNFQ